MVTMTMVKKKTTRVEKTRWEKQAKREEKDGVGGGGWGS